VAEKKHVPAHILSSAKILWKYLQMNQPLKKSDIVIAMGSHDLRVAAYAAQLVLEGWAPLLICSGGFGRLTSGIWQESEASRFMAAAVEKGLSPKKILLEERSTNTGENLLFSKALCKKKAFQPEKCFWFINRIWNAGYGQLRGKSGQSRRQPSPLLRFRLKHIPLRIYPLNRSSISW